MKKINRQSLRNIIRKIFIYKVSVLSFVFFIAITAFGRYGETDNDKKAGPKKDSAAASDYGFKDLFSNNQFNPDQTYITQLNPLAVPFVEEYVASQGKELEAMKEWAQPYFRMMDGILSSYGIPKEMKYLAVIESHLKPALISWAGAVGPWQFMPESGRRMGLTVNAYNDERTNYYKSTHAAAKYMRELYSQLGDWLLVVAAYNCGPGRVFSAIRKSGSHSFWDLQYYLPLESRNHVKKFIGTHYIMEGAGGLTTSTTEEWNAQLERIRLTTEIKNIQNSEPIAGIEELNIAGKYNSLLIAKNLNMDIAEFNKLNPGFDKMVDTKDGYNLRLPKDKLSLFNANKYIILHECIVALMQNTENNTFNYPSESRLKSKNTPIKKKP